MRRFHVADRPARSAIAPEAADDQNQRDDEPAVDFSNASLYLLGIQSIFTTTTCSIISILACVLLPEGGVSAVRTTALCVTTAVILLFRPLRLGLVGVRGTATIFSALQPGTAIYIAALVTEQLLHTCVIESEVAPNWRRVVFHAATFGALVAGMWRASAPQRELDGPFLLCVSSLLAAALVPPPAVALQGPLCRSPDVFASAERVLRAVVFGTLYATAIFCTVSSRVARAGDLAVSVSRGAATSVWTLAAHAFLLPLAVVQVALLVYCRFGADADKSSSLSRRFPTHGYERVNTESISRGHSPAPTPDASAPPPQMLPMPQVQPPPQPAQPPQPPPQPPQPQAPRPPMDDNQDFFRMPDAPPSRPPQPQAQPQAQAHQPVPQPHQPQAVPMPQPPQAQPVPQPVQQAHQPPAQAHQPPAQPPPQPQLLGPMPFREITTAPPAGAATGNGGAITREQMALIADRLEREQPDESSSM